MFQLVPDRHDHLDDNSDDGLDGIDDDDDAIFMFQFLPEGATVN